MLKKYSLQNKSDMQRWDAFVHMHPEGTPFHLSAWLHTIYETYSFKPLLYVSSASDGGISGVIPFFAIKGIRGYRVVSLPYSDYGGPLFDSRCQKNEVLAEILGEIGRDARYVEIRTPLQDVSGFISHDYYRRHVLQLCRELSELRSNINKRTIQYSIRKAERKGIEIIEDMTLRGVQEFYRMNTLTRKKHGIPSQPVTFFRNVYNHMVLKGHAVIYLALSGSVPIAAGIFLKFKDRVYYKYNASDPRFLSEKNPNHLLTWQAIKRSHEQGYRYFDFGRTSPDNEGLMRYKKMWGAEPVDLPYCYYPRVKGATSSEESGVLYRMLTGVWKTIPDGIAEFIGSRIYKYLG